MWICNDCGAAFEEPESKHYDLACGAWDEYCPNCGSEDIEEAVQCSICKKWFSPDETIHGVCDNCLDKSMTVATATKYGADRKETVEINGFFAWAFTPAEIDEILERELKNSGNAEKDAHTFATDDTDDFTNWLKERSEA